MTRTPLVSALALGLLAGPLSAHAAIVINAAGQSYAQNFDSLATSGTRSDNALAAGVTGKGRLVLPSSRFSEVQQPPLRPGFRCG